MLSTSHNILVSRWVGGKLLKSRLTSSKIGSRLNGTGHFISSSTTARWGRPRQSTLAQRSFSTHALAFSRTEEKEKETSLTHRQHSSISSTHQSAAKRNFSTFSAITRPPLTLSTSINVFHKDTRTTAVSRRDYHSTSKQEILPLVGLAVVAVIGRYSYKAWKRMDDEWEDYQWELQQYEKRIAQTAPNPNTTQSIAIDIGSLYTKLAVSHPVPDVILSKEGDRHFFNGVKYDGETVIRGRSALERYFYDEADRGGDPAMAIKEGRVELPWDLLTDLSFDLDRTSTVLSDSLSPLWTEATERYGQSIIGGNSEESKPGLRVVATIPVSQLHSSSYGETFSALSKTALSSAKEHTVLLPDPVASIWGAQTRGLVPVETEAESASKPDHPPTMMVIDVGGMTTQLSVIQRDIILYASTIPIGGEDFVKQCIQLMLKESPLPLADARSQSALQIQARLAVAELTSKTRVDVHVPYLFPDPGNHHLDTSISRNVLDQALNAHVQDIAPIIAELDADTLSPHMPTPTDLSSLWMSTITQVLERSHQMPTSVDHVLIVGGGSKPPAMLESLRSALFLLMGSDVSKKIVVPDTALQMELTVLGAATMLPGYDYSVESGLKPIG